MQLNRWSLIFTGCIALAGCSDPQTPLTKTFTEPPGDACAEGGTRIAVGADVDGDGQLDEAEITSIGYVCYDPAPIEEPLKPLIDVIDEPPSEACAAGGVRIEMGVDRNGNGVLDPSEIDSTEILCGDEALNHIFLGSFYIRSDADVELLSKYSIALGHILISVPGDYHGADPSPHLTPSAFEMA